MSEVEFASGALPYAEQLGWKILLLAPGWKLPYIPKERGGQGVHDATTDPEQIASWGKLCPDGNVGVACGPTSGIVVVDVDPRNGGSASLASLAATGRILPFGPRQRTGNGGWHYLFKADPSIGGSRGRLGPGIDVKSTGGYIVAAPSWIRESKDGPGGTYRWEVTPFEVVPPRMPMIRQRKLALERRHIQLNGPASFRWMPHDIDHAGAYFAHRDANLPEPNFIAINPENGHGHSAVLLAMPVARHRAARIEPLHFYGAVERGIARRMGADRRYSGLITKNPVHPHWRVEWRREEPYTLPDLADWLFPEDMQPDFSVETTFGVGRNCIVFDELRLIAYREVRAFKSNGSLDTFQARLERVATGINTQFPNPLRPAEVRSIARSVSRWTWRRFSKEKFSELQRHRINIRWAEHISAEMTKPWAAEGVSRATWYRRREDARTKTDWATP